MSPPEQSFAAAVSALEPWQSLVLVPAALLVLVGFAAFAAAAWRMTERQRAAGRASIAAAPARLLGHDPAARAAPEPGGARRLRAAAGAARLPRRRLALRRLPADRLDPAAGGPALTWAVIPVAFSPYGQGPLRDDRLEGRARLAAGDGAALVGPALPRARAPARPLDGRPPRGKALQEPAATAPASASRSAGSRCCSSRFRSSRRSRASAAARSATRTSRG